MLPTITAPKFTLIVPSTGQSLKYRPFIVKEQKLLLSAVELGDEEQLNNAIEDIIKNCTFGEFDIDTAPVYDVEYVLLCIRAKSAGEIVDMVYKCNAKVTTTDTTIGTHTKTCGAQIPVPVQLLQAEVYKPPGHDNKIMLTDTIGIIMKDLPYSVYKSATKKNISEAGMAVVIACIDKVFDGEQIYNRKDFTDKELDAFLEGMVNMQFGKVEEFIHSMPVLRMTIALTCPECGAQDTVTLEGLDDFLA